MIPLTPRTRWMMLWNPTVRWFVKASNAPWPEPLGVDR